MRPPRGRLIHDQQDLAVFFELAEQRSQLRLVIRQSAVEKTFSLTIQCDGMMRSLACVDTDEDLDAVMLLNVSHVCSQRFTTMGQQTRAASLGIHVTGDLGLLRIQVSDN